jgi:hypothetical protein
MNLKSLELSLPPKKRVYFRPFLNALYILSLLFIAYFLINGITFYAMPYRDRPHSDLYRLMRPAGMWGHGFGVIGSAMMVLMLSYSLRKRFRLLRRLGPLSRWLNVHIYFGVMGPLLIVLHTAFKVQGLVAVSFWSMVAVACSGVFGRYLYLQIPRNIQGDEIDIKELEKSNRRYTEELQRDYNLSEEMIGKLEQRESFPIAEGTGPFRLLMTILVRDAIRPLQFGRRAGELADLRHIPREARRRIIRMAHRKSLLSRRIMLLNEMQRLFHYWHVIHKPFAIIMYAIMVIHIAVAIMTGYRWIF